MLKLISALLSSLVVMDSAVAADEQNPAGDQLADVRTIDRGGAVPRRLEHRRQGDGGEPGAGLHPAIPHAQHAEAADSGHVCLDHPLVRPGPASAGVVPAGYPGGAVWEYDLLAGPAVPGPVSSPLSS